MSPLGPAARFILMLAALFPVLGCKRASPRSPAPVATPPLVVVPAPAPTSPPVKVPDPLSSSDPTPGPTRTAGAEALEALRRGLPSPAEPHGPRHFPYYMHVNAGYVMLWHDPPESWAQGKPDTFEKSIEPDNWKKPSTAFRRVFPERMPPALRGLPGTRLQLFSGRGLVCEAKAGEVLEIAQALLNSYGHWERDGNPDFKMPKTRPEIARAIWNIDNDDEDRRGHALAVRAIPVTGKCDGAVWARVAIGPPPAIAIAEPADPAWTARARAEIRATPKWQEWQTTISDFKKEHSGATPNHDDSAEFSVWSFRPALPLGQLIAVSQQAGNECSGGYHLFAVFKVNGPLERAEFLLLMQTALGIESDLPTVAFDMDSDGQPEFLSKEGLRRTAEQADFMFLPWATGGDGCVGEDSSPAHSEPAGPGPRD